MSLSVRLRHAFPGFALDLAFEAPPGLTALYGASGSGKTTVVDAVAGLLRPREGRIAVDDRVLFDSAAGVCVPPHRRRLGYIFQEGRLFPHLTVRQNLLYGRRFAPGGGRRDGLGPVVELLGIGALLERRPARLSGGEKQRVAIGRALLSEPAAILADEPLAALDAARKAEILPYFERLRDEVSVPILYVSHAEAEVARLATTVVVLEAGRVLRQGPAARVLPAAAVARTAEGAATLLAARIVARHPDGLAELRAGDATLLLAGVAGPVGAEVALRVPARSVLLSRDPPVGLSALNVLPARVAALAPGEGGALRVTLATAAGAVAALVPARAAEALALVPGAACHAVLAEVAVRPAAPPGPG